MAATALLLIAHGSPDPDWREPLVRLAQRLREQSWPGAPPQIELAYLGFIEPDVPEAIASLYDQGHRRIVALAAFLSPGGKHIKKDVPDIIETVRPRYPDLHLELRPGALGADPLVVDALATAARRQFSG